MTRIPSTFDTERHLQIAGLLGAEAMRRAVRSLRSDAVSAFSGSGNARDEAHGLASQAETLGFQALGAACRAVEVAARAGADTEAPLATAREERDLAVRALDAWVDQEADISEAATAASDLFRTPRALNSAAR